MVQKIGPNENNIVFKFGGGLHTRASPDEIDGREAAGGFNFQIDIQNRNLRNRPAFDLVGRAPNNAAIRGAASYLTTGGVVHALFQAGNTVYSWDGNVTFTSLGSVSAGCKLRGHWKTHVWNLADKVLITDLTLTDPVYEWDGTPSGFKTVSFVDQLNNPFGVFKAKYLGVNTERAIFANVFAATATPHLIVGCKQSNYNQITIVNRPSSSLGNGDPFFLPTPDLKPINSFLSTYLGTMVSTERGEIFNLGGANATNFQFNTFYSNSGASGLESVCEIGNDFIYGRPGRIESVRDTNTFGNSQAADLTQGISDQIAGYPGWTIVFNTRTRKAYCFPSTISEVWALDAAIRDAAQISPWQRWRTSHALAFQPTMVMSMLSPADGLEYIFMGDNAGNIYRLEGTGTGGDGGTNTIDMQFQTKLASVQLDARAYDYEGYVKYTQQQSPSTLNLSFQYQGENIFTNSINIPLSAAPSGSYFSGPASYYNSGIFYNQISGKLSRTAFRMPGTANELQAVVEVIGTNPVSINEIGIRFRAASA